MQTSGWHTHLPCPALPDNPQSGLPDPAGYPRCHTGHLPDCTAYPALPSHSLYRVLPDRLSGCLNTSGCTPVPDTAARCIPSHCPEASPMYPHRRRTAGWQPAPQMIPAMPEPLLPLRSEAPFSFFYVSFPVPTSFLFPFTLRFTHTCPVTEFAVASHLNTANS